MQLPGASVCCVRQAAALAGQCARALRGVRVAPDNVRLDMGRLKGWIPDRNMKYTLVDASRDSWVITIAIGTLPAA